MTHIALSIEGMTCGHCVSAVKQALEAVPGVTLTEVHIGGASLEGDPTPATLEAVRAAVEDAGYVAEVTTP
jgi:copper chaperone